MSRTQTVTGPVPTSQQASAIAARAPQVVVTAGAGTGKTRVLTERYLAALDEWGIEALPGIVALTFTKKAARELKERVRRACRTRFNMPPGDLRTQRFQIDLEAAPIATFHSYCASLLRRFPVEASVEPGFRELEEPVALSLREQAVRDCLDQWLANEDVGFLHVASAYGIECLSHMLIDLANDALPDGGAGGTSSTQQVIKRWATVHTEVALPDALRDFANRYAPILSDLRSIPARANKVNQKVLTLAGACAQMRHGAIEEVNLKQIRDAALLTGTRVTDWDREADQVTYKACFGAIAKELEKLIEWSVDSPAITHAMAERSLELKRLGEAVADRYRELKQTAGVLDFDDLQQHTLRLLRESGPPVRAAICSPIRLVLVDEFQDTDRVQAEILEHLRSKSGASLVAVGDVKQSIYGFRGARPQLFEALNRSVPAHDRHQLTENFRSVPKIVHFINSLFENVFEGSDYHLLSKRREPARQYETPVLLNPCHALLDSKTPVETRRAIEARAIAQYVAQQMANEWPVWDNVAQTWRAAHAGDVALLFRTTKDIEVYQGAFASCAIDTHVVGGRAYFSQQEVIDLVNLLRVIEDPYDELALAGVLRSPWIGVDDEGLWQSAALHGLADGFWRDLATEGLSTRNRDRLERARRLLTSWREAKDRISIARLVDRVLDESGMEATAALMPLGDQKYANLRKLVRVASNFDAHGGWSLADFVHRIRSDLEGDAREELGVVSEEEGTAVRLMTIHQAKGLEFPIVVLPDLDRSNVNRSAAIGRDDALGLIPRPADNLDRDDLLRQAADGSEYGLSLGDAALHLLEHVRTRHEAYRLLYVAMTRARDHLVLSTTLLSHEGARSIFGTLLFSKFDRETGRSLSSTVDWPAARIHIAQSESLTEAGAVPSSRRLPAAWIAAARAIEQGLHGRCAPENSS